MSLQDFYLSSRESLSRNTDEQLLGILNHEVLASAAGAWVGARGAFLKALDEVLEERGLIPGLPLPLNRQHFYRQNEEGKFEAIQQIKVSSIREEYEPMRRDDAFRDFVNLHKETLHFDHEELRRSMIIVSKALFFYEYEGILTARGGDNHKEIVRFKK